MGEHEQTWVNMGIVRNHRKTVSSFPVMQSYVHLDVISVNVHIFFK